MKKAMNITVVLITVCLVLDPFLSIGGSLGTSNQASAVTNIEIGDYIEHGKYYNEPIIWRVIDFDELGDPLILSEKILTLRAFDTAGSYHTNVVEPEEEMGFTRYLAGSNYWRDSNLRQWLNSFEDNINWIQNPPNEENTWNEDGMTTNPYDDEAGFLSDNNFNEYERSIIKPITRVTTLHNMDLENADGGNKEYNSSTTVEEIFEDKTSYYYEKNVERVFILSLKEHKELVYDRGYELNKKPTNEAVENTTYSEPDLSKDDYWYYWLRSPYFLSYRVRTFTPRNIIGQEPAFVGVIGVAPAMYLDLEHVNIGSGDGSQNKPYKLSINKEVNILDNNVEDSNSEEEITDSEDAVAGSMSEDNGPILIILVILAVIMVGVTMSLLVILIITMIKNK